MGMAICAKRRRRSTNDNPFPPTKPKSVFLSSPRRDHFPRVKLFRAIFFDIMPNRVLNNFLAAATEYSVAYWLKYILHGFSLARVN